MNTTVALVPPPSNACYIWTDSHGAGRNRWALFRASFHLDGQPAGGTLHLFADARYRLIVNGRTVCHGPARFFLNKPEYDTIDLGRYLVRGENVIAVVVNSPGAVTFHTDVSVAALIAWGEARDDRGHGVAIATDSSSWRAIESAAHYPDTHYLSFALNPAEQLDLGKMPAGWDRPGFGDRDWPAAVRHADPAHWAALHPRSIPLLDERRVSPRRRLGTWLARPPRGEEVYSLMLIAPGGQSLHTRARMLLVTHIHSPRDQQVTLRAWWGRYWINGEELEPTNKQPEHLRQDYPATLRKGWNTLQVSAPTGADWWDFYLSAPSDAGLELRAERDLASRDAFLIGGMWTGEQFAAAETMTVPLNDESPTLPASLGPWQRWPRGKRADNPIRERAWRTFERLPDGAVVWTSHVGARLASPVAAPPQPRTATQVSPLQQPAARDALVFLYDFDTEVLGRPVLDFTAAAGTTIDFSYSQRLKADGTSDIHNRVYVDMIERYTAGEGRQTIHTFHPRGFRYLEVIVTGDLSQFELHDVGLTRANYPVEPVGRFECSDPVLNAVWWLGQRTQFACMEDAYVDTPWRERGLYSGDFLVQYFTNLACFGDHALFRRCIELFLLAQGTDNGLVPAGAHGLPPGRHPDYSAIIPQTLWCYWSRTGDVAFLRQMLPRLKKLLAGLEALAVPGERELLGGEELHPYLDNCRMDKAGINCALNCFYQRGFADGARVLEVAGDPEAARHYAARAERLAAAIRESFWDDSLGAFTDRRKADKPDTEPSAPANTLPLLYGIASPQQAPRALGWLVAALHDNFRGNSSPNRTGECNVQSYFAFYSLAALYQAGRAVDAERFIRTYWGRMIDHGAWTCWEYLVDRGSASRCHAWSSGPTHYLSTEVLGLTFPEPGNPRKVELRPQPGTLSWASGVYPHADGSIAVKWELEYGAIKLAWEVPEAVDVIIAGKCVARAGSAHMPNPHESRRR